MIFETERLAIRFITEEDASFLWNLLKDPTWVKYIGDKGFTSVEEVKQYIQDGFILMYATYGHGLYVVEQKDSGKPVGICGIVKRIGLEHPDLGFAFLSEFQGKGYGFEASQATLKYGKDFLKMKKILAITTRGNVASARVLEKLGMIKVGETMLPNQDKLYDLYEEKCLEE
ncbi:GNAT family N-acetyltransferase [Mangrovibacillus cuniculi]|uniref:GNAT family N-acetyltransferase n=1 Tax=Mangrovibacillus cuniculi TaxID=2593652 RepID=A0A7S8C910_9BACI|nr:GNAT family N-acetyltransferase [Mangrovibacillus cuniculi]QPC45631.1 GNAT family N-acetyltransferase [Mangrovibacillus cuniculi]